MTDKTGFMADFPDADLMKQLGDDVVFKPAVGVEKSGKAVLYFDGELIGEVSNAYSQSVEIEFLSSDFPVVARGDIFSYGDDDYKVEHQVKTFDADAYLRFSLSKV